MIITIDTHKDDADSIRKAISLLQALAGGALTGSPVGTNALFSPSGPSEGSAAAFAGMFGDDTPPLMQAMPSMPSLSSMQTQSASAPASSLSASALAAAVPQKQEEIEFY